MGPCRNTRTTADAPGILPVAWSRAATRRFYDRLSGVYDLLSEWSEGPSRKAGLRLLNVQPGERVFEIGSGPGRSLIELAHVVGSAGIAAGVDLSEGMLRAAAERL